MGIPDKEINLDIVSQYDLQGDPWVLPIVVFDDPHFTKLGVASAVAEATASFLYLAESNEELKQRVAAWENTKQIRKIVRRAKGNSWVKALNSGENLVRSYGKEGTAAVIAPHPVKETPKNIGKLQMSGFKNLDTGFFREKKYLPTIFVSPYADMSVGKMAAQVSHASHLLYRKISPQTKEEWRIRGDFQSNIEFLQQEYWDALVAQYSPDIQVHDGGYTEIPRGTRTALAFWYNPFHTKSKSKSLTEQLF